MKAKIKYTEEPKDGWELPETGFEVVSREKQKKAGIPAVQSIGTEYERSESGGKVTLRPRGGKREGAGRKPAGHVRMQLLVLPKTRLKIERLAKKQKVTLSKVVDLIADSL